MPRTIASAVARREPRSLPHRVDERLVERDVAVDRPDQPDAREDLHEPLPCERRRRTDVERVAGGEDVDPRRVAQHVRQHREVPLLELDLEGAVARERLRRGLRVVETPLVRRQRRAETGLQARVDAPRLALPGDRREPPERGRNRQQREQHEIEDELDFEATQRRSHTTLDTCCPEPPRRYLDRVMFSAVRGPNMRGIERVVAAILLAGAVAGAAAFSFMVSHGPDVRSEFGLPSQGAPRIVEVAPLPGLGGLVVQAAPAARAGSGTSILANAKPLTIARLVPLPRLVTPGTKPATPHPSPAAPVSRRAGARGSVRPGADPDAGGACSAPAPVAPVPAAPAAPAPVTPVTPVTRRSRRRRRRRHRCLRPSSRSLRRRRRSRCCRSRPGRLSRRRFQFRPRRPRRCRSTARREPEAATATADLRG